MVKIGKAAWWGRPFVAAMLVWGGVPPMAHAAAPREVVVTEPALKRTVHLAPGDRLRLVLPANGTTGYTWVAARVPATLRARAGRYQPAATPAGVVGAGGEQTLLFDAVRRGSGVLRLRYRPPWKGGMVGETVDVRVVIGR